VDAESGAAVAGAILGGRSFTEGAETDQVPPLIFNGTPNLPLSEADGSFVLSFGTSIVPCNPAPNFPRPDQLEIIILRDGCEQRLVIEINDDTGRFIDGEFSDYALELTDPILVPPCEQPP
jgi:hypothetical protein